jgi:hypothetical protein
VVFPEIEGIHAFDEVGATLDMIEALQPAVVLPGHGALFTDVAAALTEARRKLAGFVADPRKRALRRQGAAEIQAAGMAADCHGRRPPVDAGHPTSARCTPATLPPTRPPPGHRAWCTSWSAPAPPPCSGGVLHNR